jgi:hypothetical protein
VGAVIEVNSIFCGEVKVCGQTEWHYISWVVQQIQLLLCVSKQETGGFLVYIMEGWCVILLEMSMFCIDD